jgi:Zn-dependent protease with chaperone function
MNQVAKKKKVFPGISARAFEHPADRAALVALRKMTGFDTLVKTIIGNLGERKIRMIFLANSIRLGPKQVPRIHRLLAEACEILGIEDVPELYVMQSPHLNAMAVGVDKPFIVLNSSLASSLDDEELRCVLGHELGHILSGHALYRTLSLILLRLGGHIVPGPLQLLWLPILLALREWERKSELSCDRAGLLVTQDLAVCHRVILKLAGATSMDGFSLEEFERQAKEYEEDGSLLDDVFKLMNLLFFSHPFPVQRFKELRAWHESPEFAKIMGGEYARRTEDPHVTIAAEVGHGARSYKEKFEKSADSVGVFAKDLYEAGGEVWKVLSGEKKRKKASGE